MYLIIVGAMAYELNIEEVLIKHIVFPVVKAAWALTDLFMSAIGR